MNNNKLIYSSFMAGLVTAVGVFLPLYSRFGQAAGLIVGLSVGACVGVLVYAIAGAKDNETDTGLNPVQRRELAYFFDVYAWTRGTLARNREGEPCGTMADEAYFFSARGAIMRVLNIDSSKARYTDQRMGRVLDVELDLRAVLAVDSVEKWNDAPARTVFEVRAAFRKAMGVDSGKAATR